MLNLSMADLKAQAAALKVYNKHLHNLVCERKHTITHSTPVQQLYCSDISSPFRTTEGEELGVPSMGLTERIGHLAMVPLVREVPLG